MSIRTTVARLLIALALIVQIWAPVGSSTMVVAAATDPFAGFALCEHDDGSIGDRDRARALASHAPVLCDLCQLAASGGWTPEEPTVIGFVEVPAMRLADWSLRVETVVDARFLARLRGRAPPAFA